MRPSNKSKKSIKGAEPPRMKKRASKSSTTLTIASSSDEEDDEVLDEAVRSGKVYVYTIKHLIEQN